MTLTYSEKKSSSVPAPHVLSSPSSLTIPNTPDPRLPDPRPHLQTFSALIVGPPGSGKSRMALTAPRPIHVLDIDKKMHQLDGLVDFTDVTYKQFPETGRKRISVSSSPDMRDPGKGFDPTSDPRLYYSVTDEINSFYDILDKGGTLPFRTLVIDTISRLGEHLELLVMKLHHHDVLTISDWRTFLGNMLNLLNGLVDLPCNVVVTCHAKTEVDEITKAVRVLPGIAGQTAEKIGGFFQESYFLVPRLEGEEMKVDVLTRATSKYSLRTSLCDLSIVPADLTRIVQGDFRGENAKKILEERNKLKEMKGGATGQSWALGQQKEQKEQKEQKKQ